MALPVITKQPSSTVVPVFSTGSFECTARSYGTVSTTWKRLNSELPESVSMTESQSLNELTSVLRLENVGYYKGFYYCEIENRVGIVNTTLAHYDISGIYIIILYCPRTGFSKITLFSLKLHLSNLDVVFYCKERIFLYRFGFPTHTFDSG